MDIYLQGSSAVYWLVGFGWLVCDWLILSRVLPYRWWVRLCRTPSTFLHESAHWLVAVVIGANPRMSIGYRLLEDGTNELGSVTTDDTCFGFLGRSAIASAPLWLMIPAVWIGWSVLTQPQPLPVGLAWLMLAYWLTVAAQMSTDDFKLMGFMGKLAALSVLVLVAVLTIQRTPLAQFFT